jgi:phytoene dehydrogenase-like protein
VPPPVDSGRFDAIVVGGGHNALVAATLLGRAGLSVLVLERAARVGGAAVSERIFAGLDAYVSRYAYLVSLFPAALLRALGINVELRRRTVASYTPVGDSGLLDAGAGPPDELAGTVRRVAERVFPTLTEPLISREDFRRHLGDEAAWHQLFEQPLSGLLERAIPEDDVRRGVALTDATIGTFAPATDPELRQNRCFLYHVVGNGTGSWDVPVGGMGALTAALETAARGAGAIIRSRAEVVRIETDGCTAEVTGADGELYEASHVLAGVAPQLLSRLLGETVAEPEPEGAQLKLNMLLTRLPRLRDPGTPAEQAFAGTFHVNERYEQLQHAYEQAAAGTIPSLPPCELYCHSLTDSSILSEELRSAGAHTLTLFGLHMPTRLFAENPEGAKRTAVEATLESVNSVLAEPIQDCLAVDSEGVPCLEAHTPLDLEHELALPGGHIFHRDLSWPFAEAEDEIGRWGAETEHANVWLCGAGARRGGCVSGIPGHNAARAVLEAHPSVQANRARSGVRTTSGS